jgi:hypothetical protein
MACSPFLFFAALLLASQQCVASVQNTPVVDADTSVGEERDGSCASQMKGELPQVAQQQLPTDRAQEQDGLEAEKHAEAHRVKQAAALEQQLQAMGVKLTDLAHQLQASRQQADAIQHELTALHDQYTLLGGVPLGEVAPVTHFGLFEKVFLYINVDWVQ